MLSIGGVIFDMNKTLRQKGAIEENGQYFPVKVEFFTELQSSRRKLQRNKLFNGYIFFPYLAEEKKIQTKRCYLTH